MIRDLAGEEAGAAFEDQHACACISRDGGQLGKLLDHGDRIPERALARGT